MIRGAVFEYRRGTLALLCDSIDRICFAYETLLFDFFLFASELVENGKLGRRGSNGIEAEDLRRS
jgi:hypothetical protein